MRKYFGKLGAVCSSYTNSPIRTFSVSSLRFMTPCTPLAYQSDTHRAYTSHAWQWFSQKFLYKEAPPAGKNSQKNGRKMEEKCTPVPGCKTQGMFCICVQAFGPAEGAHTQDSKEPILRVRGFTGGYPKNPQKFVQGVAQKKKMGGTMVIFFLAVSLGTALSL